MCSSTNVIPEFWTVLGSFASPQPTLYVFQKFLSSKSPDYFINLYKVLSRYLSESFVTKASLQGVACLLLDDGTLVTPKSGPLYMCSEEGMGACADVRCPHMDVCEGVCASVCVKIEVHSH